jgi:hypothetical protein
MAVKDAIPVVLFDEFDSSFQDQRLGWLSQFLMPMQDGQFNHNGPSWALGCTIFVFIGGTSYTFEDFRKPSEEGPGGESADRQVKKPDFLSRLHGHVNVAGPNPNSKEDAMFIMRRAMLLRRMLQKRLEVRKDQDIFVQEQLLGALLQAEEFNNGSQSIEQILDSSKLSNCQKLNPSALPSHTQLGMHLNVNDFKSKMKQPED